MSFTAGQKVLVDKTASDVVYCDQIDNIAGNECFVVDIYEDDNEAFVVAKEGDEEGSYIPLELLSPA